MRCFWELTGVLGSIYRAVGRGLNDRDIARKVNLTILNVQNCLAWIVHFLDLKSREDVVLYVSSAA
jgi:DNA-binding NarL/FixJ family response regulator